MKAAARAAKVIYVVSPSTETNACYFVDFPSIHGKFSLIGNNSTIYLYEF